MHIPVPLRRLLQVLFVLGALYMAMVLAAGGLRFEIGGRIVQTEKLFIPGLVVVVPLLVLVFPPTLAGFRSFWKGEPHDSPTPAPRWEPCPRRFWTWMALIALLAVLTWSGSVEGGFIMDDFYMLDLVRQRPRLDQILTFFGERTGGGEYRPLGVFTWWIQYHFLGGLDPMPYHVFNLAVHGLNVFLVALFAWRWSGSRAVSMIAATLFGFGPLHAETISWLIDRYDLLATAFGLLSALAFLHSLQGSRVGTLFSVLALAGALLCKESSLTFPAFLWLIAFLHPRSPTTGTHRFLKATRAIGPHTILWLAYLGLRLTLFSGMGGYDRPGGLIDGPKLLAFPFSPLIAMFFPVNIPSVRELSLLSRVGIALVLLAVPVLFLRRFSHRPIPHLGLYGMILLLACPVYGVLNLSHNLQGSRYLYLPMVPFSILIAGLLEDAFGPTRRLAVSAGVLALTYGVLARCNNDPWVKAGILARRSAQEARVLLPHLEKGDRVRVEGMIEDLDGAFLFRGYGFQATIELYLGVSAKNLQHAQESTASFDADPDVVFRHVPGEGFRRVPEELEPRGKEPS